MRQRVLEEVGDVPWNLPRAVDALGSSLPEVAAASLARLRTRYHEAGAPLRPPEV